MQKRRLGNTDILVSPIGLGTVKFGRNAYVKYPSAFDLPTDAALRALLHKAQTLGVNLLDTAPAYGLSEERLGQLLQGQRQQWVISSKVGEHFLDGKSTFDFSPVGIQKSVERSLRHLHTDYIDILLVHSDGNDELLIQQNIFDPLEKLKHQGKIRAYGMSTKTVAGGIQAVEMSDVAMVTYNPVATAERSVIQHAQALNKGILIKKAFVSGHLDKIESTDPVLAAMRFIFAEPGVTSVIVGTLNPDHLHQNVECALRFL